MKFFVRERMVVEGKGGWATMLLALVCLANSTGVWSQAVSVAPVKMWVASTLQRVFPTSPLSEKKDIRLLSARNATLSFQAVVRSEAPKRGLRVKCEVDGGKDL